jgi:hypothetical protein
MSARSRILAMTGGRELLGALDSKIPCSIASTRRMKEKMHFLQTTSWSLGRSQSPAW